MLLALPAAGTVQKSAASRRPAHAAALREYLAKHRDFDSVPETNCDQESLKAVREQFGVRFTAFQKVGDFGHDGRQGFALVLVRGGASSYCRYKTLGVGLLNGTL